MGDMGDDFNAMQAATQVRHADLKVRNLLALQNTTLIFKQVNQGETLLFREANKPKVDFYPSTGRWRVAGVKETFRGGAKGFINWYAKQ